MNKFIRPVVRYLISYELKTENLLKTCELQIAGLPKIKHIGIENKGFNIDETVQKFMTSCFSLITN